MEFLGAEAERLFRYHWIRNERWMDAVGIGRAVKKDCRKEGRSIAHCLLVDTTVADAIVMI